MFASPGMMNDHFARLLKAAVRWRPVHCEWIGPIFGPTFTKFWEQRHDPDCRRSRFAALRTFAPRPPERRLTAAGPLLYRRRVGRHAVAARDQSRQWRRARQGAGPRHRRDDASGRGG